MGLNGVCVSMATAEVQALVQLTTHTLTYQVCSNCGVTVPKSFQKLFHTWIAMLRYSGFFFSKVS